jgi:4-diphosphocytidyl-2-C-methyl-D-erythritol kinase
MERDTLVLEAPAKINLGLEVVRRRPDGYHDINTLFVAIDLSDRIELRSRGDRKITCAVPAQPELEVDPSNLCIRAASLLRDHLQRPELGVAIHLDKHIPIGAGLGGGSSDAAAVLRGASRLWGTEAPSHVLADLASRLGSDVPFFLHGGVMHGSSRGEVLDPIDLHLPFHLLLLFPGIHVATPWAYRAVNRTGERMSTDLVALLHRGVVQPSLLREHLENDFEVPIFAEYPRLGILKQRLYDAGALYAAMSGSGSTIFGLFNTKEEARHGALELADIRNAVARFLPPVDSTTTDPTTEAS